MTTINNPRCDMFCRVIDNFGDAGIAWRLAQSLTQEKGWRVRLIIDDRATLSAMVPEVCITSENQTVKGVTICGWEDAMQNAPADIVIELFSCFLPENYEASINEAICSATRRPAVFALDYLTAESYAEESNGLQSPHPRYGYPKTFLFPGFTEKTCGVIYEADLPARCKAFVQNNRRKEILSALHTDPEHPMTLFFFAYPQKQIESLAQAFADDSRPLQILAAPGQARQKLIDALKNAGSPEHVHVVEAPMVPQSEFDDVLMSCDAALVRGEDSTMRAQLTGTPLLWMLYPQEENTHWVKFDAFARLYQESLPDNARTPWLELSNLINGKPADPAAWSRWRDAYDDMKKGALAWQKRLFSSDSLTERLCARVQIR